VTITAEAPAARDAPPVQDSRQPDLATGSEPISSMFPGAAQRSPLSCALATRAKTVRFSELRPRNSEPRSPTRTPAADSSALSRFIRGVIPRRRTAVCNILRTCRDASLLRSQQGGHATALLGPRSIYVPSTHRCAPRFGFRFPCYDYGPYLSGLRARTISRRALGGRAPLGRRRG
jgi:hypothetical protein